MSQNEADDVEAEPVEVVGECANGTFDKTSAVPTTVDNLNQQATISIPHIGQASPFGQSLSDRDVFRLRLAPVDQILTNGFHTLCGNHDDHFWDQIPMRHAGRCDKQHFFHFTKYQILCYNNMPTMII